MNSVSGLLSAIRRGGWAPISVLLLHQLCNKIGWRSQSDHLIHFLGGVAISIFLFHLIDAFRPLLGDLTRVGHTILTFVSAATIALAWDLSEFASDQLLGTDIQHSLQETMLDLAFGVLGAAIICPILFYYGKGSSTSSRP